jgi:GNAT superfamily N-acetyltransferase
MLNFIKAEKGTNEMIEALNKASTIIDLYPEIFPHLYKQSFKLEKYIEKGGLILQDGVVVTFGRYGSNGKMSRNATTYKKKGDYILHQIANIDQHNGNAKKVLNEFIEYCKSQHAENLFLTVRKYNDKAVNFYYRNGFVKDSDINWTSKKDGVIPGIVFRLRLVADKNIETVCS